jgi:hypothetical protein
VAGPVWAGEGGEKQGRMRERMKERMEQRQERRGQRVQAFKQIEDLTDEQKAKIQELHKGLREKMRAAKTREERAKLIATVRRVKIFATLRQNVKKLLTEEQVKKLEAARPRAGRRPGPRRRANQRDEKQGDEDPKPVFD